MGIHVQFNTEDLSASDIAVLEALSRSLADPEWVAAAEDAIAKSTKRGPGRPRKTDEEKAADAAARAEERAAAKAAKEKEERDAKEAAATEAAAAVDSEPEEPEAETPAEEPEEAAPAPKKAPAKSAPTKPAPAPEKPTESDSEDGKAEAVRLATSLVQDGRGAEVRSALNEVGAKKVSDLNGKSLDGFLAIAREL